MGESFGYSGTNSPTAWAITPRGIPEDWREREYHPDIDSWRAVSAINAGLTELDQRVCEVLKEEYVDWAADYEPPEDRPTSDPLSRR